jgi:hypothetical protein
MRLWTRFLFVLALTCFPLACSSAESDAGDGGSAGSAGSPERTVDDPMALTPFPGTDPIPTPAVVAGKGTWATISIPDDGDKRDVAIYAAAIEGLVNRSNWLAWRTENNDGGSVAHTFVPVTPPTVDPRWALINALVGMWMTDVTDPENGAAAMMEFTDVPDGVKITSAIVYIDPSNSHSNLPTTKPILKLNAIDVATGTITPLGTTTDAPADLTAYQARHSITVTVASPFKYDKAVHKLVAVIQAEAGANAKSAMVVEGCRCTWARDE